MIDPNNLQCAFFPFKKGTYFLVKDTVINGSHSPISREPFTFSIDRFTPLVTEMSLSSTKIDSYRSGLGDGGEREPCVCLKIAQLRGLPRTLPSFFSRRVFVRIPSLDCLALFFCFSMLLEAISSNQPFSSVIRNASQLSTEQVTTFDFRRITICYEASLLSSIVLSSQITIATEAIRYSHC